jgi:Flp pilus assembly pilin Flp
MRTLLKLWVDDDAQSLIEYVLIIALVAIGLLVVLVAFRNAMGKIFKTVADTLNAAPTTVYPTS